MYKKNEHDRSQLILMEIIIVRKFVLIVSLFSVLCFGYFVYNGLHCQVMELLEYNIRQLIFRNDRQGLSPWLTQKCARDLLT